MPSSVRGDAAADAPVAGDPLVVIHPGPPTRTDVRHESRADTRHPRRISPSPVAPTEAGRQVCAPRPTTCERSISTASARPGVRPVSTEGDRRRSLWVLASTHYVRLGNTMQGIDIAGSVRLVGLATVADLSGWARDRVTGLRLVVPVGGGPRARICWVSASVRRGYGPIPSVARLGWGSADGWRRQRRVGSADRGWLELSVWRSAGHGGGRGVDGWWSRVEA
jgi:hypothetical protein